MPRDEATMAVPHGLREGIAQRGLCTEIHLTEEELAEEVSGDGGCFFAFVLLVGEHGVVGAPIEEADGEGAEVVVWGKEGCRLRVNGRGCCGGLGEGGGVGFVGNYIFERFECEGFAATVGGYGAVEAEFGV